MHEGFNSGRTYYLQCVSKEASESISKEIRKLVEFERSKLEGTTRLMRTQRSVRNFYLSGPFQVFSSLLIITVRGRSPHETEHENTRNGCPAA